LGRSDDEEVEARGVEPLFGQQGVQGNLRSSINVDGYLFYELYEFSWTHLYGLSIGLIWPASGNTPILDIGWLDSTTGMGSVEIVLPRRRIARRP
jgi:hypothetical protein